MNWKKFLIGTGVSVVIGGLTAIGLAWAPVYLLPYAPIWTWATEVGIALGGLWGIKKTWEIVINAPTQKVADPIQVASVPRDVKKIQKENKQE